MKRQAITLAAVLVLALVGSTKTDAAYTITFNQVGNNVVETGTGTLVTTGPRNGIYTSNANVSQILGGY